MSPASYRELPLSLCLFSSLAASPELGPAGSAPGLETPSLQAFTIILVLVTCAASALPWSSCSLLGPWGPQKTEVRCGFQGGQDSSGSGLCLAWPLWEPLGTSLLAPAPASLGRERRRNLESLGEQLHLTTDLRQVTTSPGLVAFL